MQHSPQEIKTILDRVVDPDGNVLEMAAVLEVVTILERLPITKEALEKTRLGKTINLLRKKTTNEELARRAKGLVKKWQKLVFNQLGTFRNTDSPINGSRVSSPQINGAIRGTESPGTPTLERGDKSKLLEGKKRGVKRKRDSCSSSENSPVVFLKSDDLSSQPGTPSLSDDPGLGSAASLPEFQRSSQEDSSSALSQTDNCRSAETNPDCSPDSGIESQKDNGNLVQGSQSKTTLAESENNESLPKTANDSNAPQSCQEKLTDTRWSPSLNHEGLCCESISREAVVTNVPIIEDNVEPNIPQQTLEEEEQCPYEPKELVLDVNVQADGVTGRYGGDGAWYNWTEVMPSSDGALQLLPYVILE